MIASAFRWNLNAIGWCAAAIILSMGLHAAQSSSPIRVVSAERFETLPFNQLGRMGTLTADKDTVLLVVLVNGVTMEDMNRTPLEEYFITVSEKRYDCLSLDIMPKIERELVCRAPRNAKDLVLHIGNKAPVKFSVIGPIKPGRKKVL